MTHALIQLAAGAIGLLAALSIAECSARACERWTATRAELAAIEAREGEQS